MVGTTDVFCDATHFNEPDQEEIDFLIEEIKPFLGKDYDYKSNLISAWAGLRPLVKSCDTDIPNLESSAMSRFLQARFRWILSKVKPPKKGKTASMSRNHVIEMDKDSGLVSLMGGKWTAYRVQGEQTTDRILERFPDLKRKLKYEEGQTLNFNLIGSYSKAEFTDGVKQTNGALFKQYEDHLVFDYDMDRDIAKHLVKTHGTAAVRVAKVAQEAKLLNKRLSEKYYFCEAEVLYSIREEMAQKPTDVVCRRVPVSFIDTVETRDVILPKVVEIFAKELKWSTERKQKELAEAQAGL